MMEIALAEYLPAAATLVALFALILAATAMRGRGRLLRTLQLQEERLAVLDKQVKAMTSGAVGVGRRVLELENRLSSMQQQNNEPDTQDIAYTQAMQLFDQGVDPETVATSCGLSSAEIGLMALLHKHKARAA